MGGWIEVVVVDEYRRLRGSRVMDAFAGGDEGENGREREREVGCAVGGRRYMRYSGRKGRWDE